MKCGAPQGSRVKPLVWNVMYDDFLRTDQAAGTSVIGFADDALVECAAKDIGILELTIYESLWWTKRWLDSRSLEMTPKKTEALIVLGEHEVAWSRNIKYLGVQLDRKE